MLEAQGGWITYDPTGDFGAVMMMENAENAKDDIAGGFPEREEVMQEEML